MISKIIGAKLRINVCKMNIHFPFLEVGENLQSPLDISCIEDVVDMVPDLLIPDTEKKSILIAGALLVVLGPSLDFGQPSFLISQAKQSFFQKRRAKLSFLLSKPSQTELSVFQN